MAGVGGALTYSTQTDGRKQTHKVVVEEKKEIRRFGKTRTRQAAGAAHLEENLVAVQVLGLPAGGADGATGVWQQRDQLADFIHVELQHGGAAGLHWDPCRELLQGQLQTHTWLCSSSSDNQESTQQPETTRESTQ